MGSTFKELKRRVSLGFKDLDGTTAMLTEQAINDACKAIARIHDYPELLVWDKTNAVTVASTYRYSFTTLALVRPKDIYKIVLHDDANSRELTRITPQDVDKWFPYPEQMGEDRPGLYCQFGEYLEFYKIPDDAYTLYIRHSQWPVELTLDADTCSYNANLDDVIVQLAKEQVIAYQTNAMGDLSKRAKILLGKSVEEDRHHPDQLWIMKGFNTKDYIPLGEYWKDPFVKQVR